MPCGEILSVAVLPCLTLEVVVVDRDLLVGSVVLGLYIYISACDAVLAEVGLCGIHLYAIIRRSAGGTGDNAERADQDAKYSDNGNSFLDSRFHHFTLLELIYCCFVYLYPRECLVHLTVRHYTT